MRQTRPASTHGTAPSAGLPASLAGTRVLDLGSSGSGDRRRFEDLGAEEVVEGTPPLDRRPGPPRSFGFVHCGALPVDGRQLLLLSRLWHLAAPGASLLLGSRVLDAAEASRYLSVRAGPAGLEWIPGRLALRWLVESSGFDVLRWLPEEAVGRPSTEPFAYLAARRSERSPALLEQVGAPVDEAASPAGEASTNGGAPGSSRPDDAYAQRVPD